MVVKSTYINIPIYMMFTGMEITDRPPVQDR